MINSSEKKESNKKIELLFNFCKNYNMGRKEKNQLYRLFDESNGNEIL